MEHANALTVFPSPAAPPPTYAPKPYAGHDRSFRKGGYSQKKGGRDRDHDRSAPSATNIKPSDTSDVQTVISGRYKAMMRPLARNDPICAFDYSDLIFQLNISYPFINC